MIVFIIIIESEINLQEREWSGAKRYQGFFRDDFKNMPEAIYTYTPSQPAKASQIYINTFIFCDSAICISYSPSLPSSLF